MTDEEERHETLTSAEGRRLHRLAEEAIEAEDRTRAHQRITEAINAYKRDGDLLGEAEAYASRFRAYRQAYEANGDAKDADQAREAILTATRIARASGNPEALPLPYFNLGKAYEMVGDLPNAIKAYEETLKHPLPASHRFPAVTADIEIHLTTTQYKNGDKAALPQAEIALTKLESAEHPDPYAKIVWISGGHMRFADMLRTDNPQKARSHLGSARKMITENKETFPKLALRDKQLTKLEATFS